MEIQMSAQIDGRGPLTMESLAQAWDTLTAKDVPADARLQVNTALSGRWLITARWIPADPEPDETEAEDADGIELEVIQDPAVPRGNVILTNNLEAVRDELNRPLRNYIAPDPDPVKVAEAVQRRHDTLGYLVGHQWSNGRWI